MVSLVAEVNKMTTTALVDGNALMWRAAYGMGTANNGVVTGFLNLLSDVLETIQPERLVIFYDEGKSRWRTLCYPEYKQDRTERRDKSEVDVEEVFSQIREARKVLQVFGVKQLCVKGVEADDLMSWFSEYYYVEFSDTVVIVSSDKDLWQLVRSNEGSQVIVYDPMKKVWVNSEFVKEYLGVLPNQVRDYKALSGDPSDNIKGARGVGPKTAVSVLAEWGNVPNLFTEVVAKELKKKKSTDKILFYSDEVESAYRVVGIPSLSESKFAINGEEFANIAKQISEEKKVDSVRANLLLSSLGNIRLDRSKIPNGLVAFPVELLRVGEEFDMNLEEVDKEVAKCSKCKLRNDCGGGFPTLAEGYSDSEIMIIGRNPGKDELVEGRPFVGRAGERLDKMLEEVGLTRRECWITNVCKCYSLNNRPVEYTEIMACLPYLKSEIKALNPKLILAFGNEAMACVTGYGASGITKHAGEVLRASSKGWAGDIDSTVILFPHPSAALREPKNETLFQYATQKLKEFLEGVSA